MVFTAFDFVTLVLIVIVAIIVFFVTKYIVEQKKWGTKKAELEKKFETIKSDLEKQLITKDKDYNKQFEELKLITLKKFKESELKHANYLADLDKKYTELIKGFRKDAVLRSRSSLMGKLWEAVAPYIPKFKYHPSDMKFIGSPIDYIIFEGMNEKDIRKVIFLEVKSGKSALNPQEKKLKNAIENKRVKWEEFRLDDITSTEIKENKDFEKELQIQLESIKEDIKQKTEIQEKLNEENYDLSDIPIEDKETIKEQLIAERMDRGARSK